MPIYEYRCGECDHVFEEIQQFSDPDPETCPKCEEEAVERLVSQSNFQLKGGGWFDDAYSTTGEVGTESGATTEAGSTESGDGGGEDAAAAE